MTVIVDALNPKPLAECSPKHAGGIHSIADPEL
jgi:hypothetical protein